MIISLADVLPHTR